MITRHGIRKPGLMWPAAVAFTTLTMACSSPGAGKTAFVGGNLWNGTGAPPILDAVIVVGAGRIEAAGAPDAVDVPRGAVVRRLDGKWIIPGLVDAHAHVERWMLAPLLAHGVTSVRDVGGDADSIVALREDVSLLKALGPRLFISGASIDGAPAQSAVAEIVRTGSEARRAVDQRVLLDVSQIMISTKIDESLLSTLMDEASTLRTPVTAHLGKVHALTAARMGVSSIEHLSGVVEASVRTPAALFRAHNDFFAGWKAVFRGWNGLDSAAIERTAVSLADAGIALIPTLIHYEAFAHLRDRQYVNGLDLSDVPTAIRERWDIPGLVRTARLTPSDFQAFRRARPKQDLFVRRFQNAGGLVAAGSNTPSQLLPPGKSLHDELRLLVQSGLTTREALLAATRDAGRLLQTDSIGVVVPGSVADFVVLGDNPLDAIENMGTIEQVVFRGQVYSPNELGAVEAAADSAGRPQ